MTEFDLGNDFLNVTLLSTFVTTYGNCRKHMLDIEILKVELFV
jgi:hypothetical protein